MSPESSTKVEHVHNPEGCWTCFVAHNGSLTFARLREANSQRLADFDAYFGMERSEINWSPAEWGCALAGEVGELCNLLKKLLRGQDIPQREIEDEAADVQIYLDLLAKRMNFSLADAVMRKFNEKSASIGSEVRL